jgi:hypothetical protein
MESIMNETSQKLNSFLSAFIIVNLVTCFLFVLPTFGDENEGWEEVRNKKGIRVLTRLVEGKPIKQARVETIMNAPIEVLYEIVTTPETWPNWFGFCKVSKTLEKIDENTLVGYFVAGLPFPFRDRDGIWLIKKEKNFEEGTAFIDLKRIPDSEDDPYGMDGVTKEKRRVRAGDMFGTCEMTRVDKNKTKVVYKAAADPNLPIPAWFMNWFAAIQPVMAIKGLTKEAKKEVYYERAGVVHNKKIAGNT